MRIVEPSATLEKITPDALRVMEAAGRTAYKSEHKITEDSAEAFVRMIMKLGHHSVVEHASASFRFVTDRGVTHEIVRHRLASYTQESSRFCNYGLGRFGKEIQVIAPPLHDEESAAEWELAMLSAEKSYLRLLEMGQSPQMARSVLPTCLKTEIVMTCNFREWVTVFGLRLSKKAHPQMRQVMGQACRILIKECPAVFDQFADMVEDCPI